MRLNARWNLRVCRLSIATTFEQVFAILEFASRAQPLAEANLLGVLTEEPGRQGV